MTGDKEVAPVEQGTHRRRRRWFVVCSLIVAIIATIGGCLFGVNRLLSVPYGPRPLFAEWRPGKEFGWCYRENPLEVDSEGTWLLFDETLNFLVLAATGDDQQKSISIGGSPSSPLEITLFADTPYATAVRGAQDKLLIVLFPGPERAEFDIGPDFARTVGWSAFSDNPGNLIEYVYQRLSPRQQLEVAEFLARTGHQIGRSTEPRDKTQRGGPSTADQ